jgi:hypothetical protein
VNIIAQHAHFILRPLLSLLRIAENFKRERSLTRQGATGLHSVLTQRCKEPQRFAKKKENNEENKSLKRKRRSIGSINGLEISYHISFSGCHWLVASVHHTALETRQWHPTRQLKFGAVLIAPSLALQASMFGLLGALRIVISSSS